MDVAKSIEQIRKQHGKELLVLGHHYQRPAVLAHTDAIGDSLELARRAASEKKATKIVFCGVHFMAESADILTGPGQTVYMPEPDAGCPMADMASESQVMAAWEALQRRGGGDWLPVVYVNSSAAIKALCGEWGGSTCTSSNAGKIFNWVLCQGKRVFFLPDEHLGVNTAHDLEITEEEIRVFDPSMEHGGLTTDELEQAKVIAWKGHCHVHTTFGINDVRHVRDQFPAAKIIVHPETPRQVVEMSDAHGSTSQIIKYVEAANSGSIIFVGTEAHLVERLAREHEGRVTVKMLSHSICPNMYMTTEESLLAVLEGWSPENAIHVEKKTADRARSALERMLTI